MSDYLQKLRELRAIGPREGRLDRLLDALIEERQNADDQPTVQVHVGSSTARALTVLQKHRVSGESLEATAKRLVGAIDAERRLHGQALIRAKKAEATLDQVRALTEDTDEFLQTPDE